MSSQVLKQVTMATVVVGTVAWGTSGSVEAAGPGVFTIKHTSAPAHESMFRDAISDSRQRSELIQPDAQPDLFRASAASSTRALPWTFGWEELETPRHLVLRYWGVQAMSRSDASSAYDVATMFREAAGLTTAY